MAITEAFKEVVKDIGAGGDDHVNQFHLDHMADHLTHSTRNHGPGQTQEDNALGISKHPSENLETFKKIPALEGCILKGLNQIEKGIGLLNIQMLNRTLKKLRPDFFLHRLKKLQE
jgi:hypothetical protein